MATTSLSDLMKEHLENRGGNKTGGLQFLIAKKPGDHEAEIVIHTQNKSKPFTLE